MAAHAHPAEESIQEEGVNAGGIAKFAGITIGFVIVLILIVYQIALVVQNNAAEKAASEAVYLDSESYKNTYTQMVHEYRLLDEATGVYRIPVDRAMELMLQENGQ